ncbi:unnamed protein product [Callosobruchus maculatus]|uniref:Uncharacterized protein n=1 Tax=Callosobruchus maculatus TaxID=64391 RepID=A0A653CLN4_CALMS|nr:unnamed protein product [Callosobruchus maculatus]
MKEHTPTVSLSSNIKCKQETMKLFYFFVVVIMAVIASFAQAQDCLSNGSPCHWRGTMVF